MAPTAISSFLRFASHIGFITILCFVTLMRNSVWNNTITFWSDAASKSPHKARTHHNLGDAFIQAGRCGDAVPSLRLALEADPWYIEPHYSLALCYARRGDFDSAIPEFTEVLRINDILKHGHYGAKAVLKYDVQVHATLGNIYNIKRLFDKSVFHYQEALKANPIDTSTRFNLALTFEQMGRLKEAGREFDEVLRIDPTDEGAKQGLQRVHRPF